MKEDAAGVEKMGEEIRGALQQTLQSVRTQTMRKQKFSRRDVLKGSTALAVGTLFAEPVRAAAPPAEAITPALIEAAKKEGKCAFYTAMDLQFAEKLGKDFEAKFPGITVRVERSGAERVFTRIGQEYSSNVHAVDVVNTADQAHCIVWKRNGWLAPYLPEEVVKHYDKAFYDAEGFEVVTRVLVSPFGYQHRPGEDGGRAEELRRPARSEMGGQDGQGASGLQRHDHELDLPDRPRSRLGVSREARQAAHHAGSVGDRHAEEDRARRARHHGRRRGLSRDPRQGGGQAGRRHLSDGGHAGRDQPERGVQGGAQSERRAAVLQLDASAARASRS